MKFALVFLYLYQAFIFNELNDKKDIIFFEDINLIGKHMGSKLNSTNCVNLPGGWHNKTSSFISNKCTILYDQLDCKTLWTPQMFQKSDVKKFEYTYSQDDIPNFDFHGTGLNDNVKSFRGCSEIENLLSLMNKKKIYLRFE